MLKNNVTTNILYKLNRNNILKGTDIDEFKALFELVYIADRIMSTPQNINDLFRANGIRCEIFRLPLSLDRFTFLLQKSRLDDKITRLERKIYKLAAIRELFDINEKLP